MENQTNVTLNSTTAAFTGQNRATSMIVGISQITVSTIFIPLQFLCAYLIHSDKDMRNPTYQFMVSLSVVDGVELCCIAFYAGIVVVSQVEQNEWVERGVGYATALCWYVSCVMLVLVAFSRWIAITRPVKTKVIFTKKVMLSSQILPWLTFALLYFYPEMIKLEFGFIPSYYTWAVETFSILGKTVQWFNFGFCSACAVIEAAFNVLSLFWVRKIRKTIDPAVRSDANQRREIKLLMQCVIIGFTFTLTECMFTVALFKGNTYIFMMALALWTLNHSINPIVYLAMNRRLRKRFLCFITCGKWQLDENAVTTVRIGQGNSRSHQ